LQKVTELGQAGIAIVVWFLFHLYTPVTRKRQWRYMLDESAPN